MQEEEEKLWNSFSKLNFSEKFYKNDLKRTIEIKETDDGNHATC